MTGFLIDNATVSFLKGFQVYFWPNDDCSATDEPCFILRGTDKACHTDSITCTALVWGKEPPTRLATGGEDATINIFTLPR